MRKQNKDALIGLGIACATVFGLYYGVPSYMERNACDLEARVAQTAARMRDAGYSRAEVMSRYPIYKGNITLVYMYPSVRPEEVYNIVYNDCRRRQTDEES